MCGGLNGRDNLEDNGGEGEGGRGENNNDGLNATLSSKARACPPSR